ncbi:hypothetical protein A374_09353 [Fictibacillus macauensis ZFHKF-1]|uniref:Uncharacterized protein n=1 Tax=Fictibacillus macauensis ZFHKF-1 TaxID=1196324 RepID=I8AI69_9BACL|nr:DUF5316 family protein [Fictibacillus macauensis]EIT85432.1 hypothetical protein A374_09353 [Fictibacillus macauensis ZFHKF-1]
MFTLFLILGIVGIIISGVFIGAWTSGDQQRSTFHSETGEHRSFRIRVALWCGLLGLLCLVIAYFLW